MVFCDGVVLVVLTFQEDDRGVNPRYGSEVLQALSSLENLSIVLDVDFAKVDAVGATLSRLDRVLMFLVRHFGKDRSCK